MQPIVIEVLNEHFCLLHNCYTTVTQRDFKRLGRAVISSATSRNLIHDEP